MITQTLYKGRYGNERPSEAQIALLQKMAVKEDVIRNLSRKEAFELIRAIMIRFYEYKFEKKQRKPFEVYIKW